MATVIKDIKKIASAIRPVVKTPRSIGKIGSVEITQGADVEIRMAILLWGPAGCGKTTFAATCPGDKLWLSLGDNEHVPIAHRSDVFVANLAGLSIDELFNQAQNDNPFGLDQILASNKNIQSVVLDSVTALTFRALQHAVKEGVGRSATFKPTMVAPGQSAYGGRNAIVLEVLTGLLKVTAKHKVHLVIIAHEADPTTVKDGRGQDVIDYISIMLGGQLVNNVTLRLSEIWYMSQTISSESERRLAFRPTRRRRPMKTRMFSDKAEPEFKLRYDADAPDKGQMTIASWHQQFVHGGYKKITVKGAKQ